MSFTKQDILARLQNGDTVDNIAAEMTAALNEAEAEKKALDAKEKKETRVLAAKRAAVNDMLDALSDYLVAAEACDMLENVRDADTDKIIDMLDGTICFAKSLEAMKNLEFQEVDRKNDIVSHFFGLLG